MCQCASIQDGAAWRVHDMPTGAYYSFKPVVEIDGAWESIQQCTECKQLWHQSTISSHANIDTYEKIDEAKSQELIRSRSK